MELVSEGPLSRVFRASVCREKEDKKPNVGVAPDVTVGDGLMADRAVADRAMADGLTSDEVTDDNSPDGRPAYALKVLRARWEKDPKALAMMCREVQAARTIRHPHVVSVLAAGLHRPPYYLVMPWLRGRTLAARLATSEPFDLPVALWIVRQVGEALGGMSAAGWIHGDVKPSNVFLSPEGHVTLLDLGFARKADETCSKTHAIDRRYFAGTGSYLSPESATSTLSVDIRGDIYSLGVVLFEMLTGRLPFECGDLAAVISQHRHSAAPNPRRFAPHLPLGVIRLVRQMLCKQPLRRPQTPQELAGCLAELEIQSFGERTVVGGGM